MDAASLSSHCEGKKQDSSRDECAKKGGDGSPHAVGMTGVGNGVGVNVREGRPRGTPLREVGWGMRMGPRIREGRLYAGKTEGRDSGIRLHGK